MHPHPSGNRFRPAFLAFFLVGFFGVSSSQAATGPAPDSRGKTVVTQVHTDAISVSMVNGGLVLGTHADIDGGQGVPLDPSLTLFNVEESTRTTVSNEPGLAFLGTPGSDVWIAPEFQENGMIWPGFSSEDVPAGVLDGDQLTLRLESVTGPGTLHVYQSDAFGEPIRRFSSTGTDYRDWPMARGTHAHANWAFSAAGTYTLTFSANATISGSPFTTTQDYTFHVGDVPAAETTTTTLTASPSLVETGDPVTLTATVSPSGAAGYVEFLDGTTVLGHEVATAGSVVFVTTDLGIGSHSLTARFVPMWLNDFTASASAAVDIQVTEEGGAPFVITGVADSYEPGQTLNAQVAGYTLQPGQQFRWYIRPHTYTSGAYGTTLQTSTSYAYSKGVSASDEGYAISAVVRQGSTNIAQTPWVNIHVVQTGTRPVLTRTDTHNPLFPGNDIELVASELNLGPGETWQLVRRYYEFHSQWATSPAQFPEPNRAIVNNNGSASSYYYAARVMSNGIAVRQSDFVLVEMLPLDIDIVGVQPLYRSGNTLNATVTIYPPLPADEGWAFEWRMGLITLLETDTDPQNIAITVPGLTVAGWNAKSLSVRVTKNGNLVAWPSMNVYVTDSHEQFISFLALAGHYHQGETINLTLLADPPLAPEDQILWEWKWPGMDWTALSGASGLSHQLIAEQGMGGLQVRATVDFAAEGMESMVSEIRTILIDDHGAAARQQSTIAGAGSFTAGDLVTLTRQLPANGSTILTTHLWGRKAAGESEFSTIAGETGSTLSFAAALADNGAEYRVSILKPDGSLAYGPSPAVSITVAPLTVTEPRLALSVDGNDLGTTLWIPTGETYQLEFSETMEEHTWQPVGAPLTGGGEPIHLTLPKTGDQGFYRLKTAAAN